MLSSDLHNLAQQVVSLYTAQMRRIVTAESCTGGMIAGALTEISGASAVLERGFIAYSNDAKVEVLGVMPDLLEQHGAVSFQTAEAMAKGALDFSLADVAVSVTGIAGPEGGSHVKPVGTVYIGIATREGVLFHYHGVFAGQRSAIRTHAVTEALRLLLSVMETDA